MKEQELGLVIVLFNPTIDDMSFLLHLSSMYYGVIVDNTVSVGKRKEKRIGKMKYIELCNNYGIAYAQNIAYDIISKENRVKYIISFDQDSRFNDDYPQKIVTQYKQIKSKEPKLGILGPLIMNKNTKEIYKSAIHKDIYHLPNFIVKPEIISSGSCFDKTLLSLVGYNDETLFIDYVDTEWCFRAISKGYICGVTTDLLLEHKVGRKELHLGRHLILISAPKRYYYQYRNYIILLFRDYVPCWFKRNIGIKFLLRYIYLPFIIDNGFKTWCNMNKGIIAGIKYIIHKK